MNSPTGTDYAAEFTRRVAVRLRPTGGARFTATHPAQGNPPEKVVEIILGIEHAPRRAVLWVKIEPICDYCTKVATRRCRDGNEPLCEDCATKQHEGLPGGKSAYTVPLTVSRWESVDFTP